MSRVAMLEAAMDGAYGRLRRRLEGLTDAEFFWQPVADCWTLRRGPTGRWTYDYAIPEPEPAPVTTIGWQVVHLATTKLVYHDWAFGPARLTFPELEIPHTAGAAVVLLDRGHVLLRDALARQSDADLDGPRKTNWGELWPAWRLFWAMIDHDALHGGTIGALRDLYRWTEANAIGPR